MKRNRYILLPGQGFNRPANKITLSPSCEFNGTAENLGYSQFELSFGTGYGAVFRRLDSDRGSRKSPLIVTDGTPDNPFSTCILRRNLERWAKGNSD
jgi:hypothetical protein